MGLCHVINKLLNDDCFSDTSTTEESDLTSSSIGGEQIYDFNTCDKDLSS